MAALLMAARGSNTGKSNPKNTGKDLQAIQSSAEGDDNDDDLDDELDDDWCFVSEDGWEEMTDSSKERLPEEMELRQIVEEVSSCISKELLHNAEDELSSDTVDEIFKTFQEVAENDLQPLIAFLKSWRDQTHAKEGSDKVELVDHTIIIEFMMELLRVSPDPEEYHLLWLKILTHFVLTTTDLDKLVKLRVAATVLGTMTAYSGVPDIQMYGCLALEPLSAIKPTPTQKPPIKGSAIHVLSQTIEKHMTCLRVIHAACQLIASIASTMVHVHMWCIQQGFSAEDVENLCGLANDVLSCIQDTLVPKLEKIALQFPYDEKIIAHLDEIWACFGCHFSIREVGDTGMTVCRRPKAHTYPGPAEHKHVTFSQNLETELPQNFSLLQLLKCKKLTNCAITRSLSVTDTDLLGKEHKHLLHSKKQSFRLKASSALIKGKSCQSDDSIEHLEYDTADESKESGITRNSSTSGSFYSCSSSLSCENKQKALPRLLESPKEKDLCESHLAAENTSSGHHGCEASENSTVFSGRNLNCSCENITNSYSEIPDICCYPPESVGSRSDEEALLDEGDGDYLQSRSQPFDSDGGQSTIGETCSIGEDTVCGSCNSFDGDCQCSFPSEDYNLEYRGSFRSDSQRCYSPDSLDQVPESVSEGFECEDIESNFGEYNEIDIVEALIKTGLMKPGDLSALDHHLSTRQSSTSEYERDVYDYDDNGVDDEVNDDYNYRSEMRADLQSSDEYDESPSCGSERNGSVRAPKNFQKLLSKWRRVSEYGKMGEYVLESPENEMNNNSLDFDESCDGRVEPLSFSRRQWISPSRSSLQNLSAIHEESSHGYDNGEEQNQCHPQNLYYDENFHNISPRGSIHENRYRMSAISLVQEDFDKLPWQENAAFTSCGESLTTEDSMTVTSGEFILSDEDSQMAPSDMVSEMSSTHRVSMISEFTTEQSITEVTESDDNTSTYSYSRPSCSSGSYTVQDFGLSGTGLQGEETLNNLNSPDILFTQSENSPEEESLAERISDYKLEPDANHDAPPKPRRTWYYQSSSDVRRSLIRNSSGKVENRYQLGLPHSAKNTIDEDYKSSGNSRNCYSSPTFDHPAVYKSETTSSSDSGVVMGSVEKLTPSSPTRVQRGVSHVYEAIPSNDHHTSEYANVSEGQCKKSHLEQQANEATYEVCTLWVNGETYKALEMFDQLSKVLVSPYSIVPVAREAEKDKGRISGFMDEDGGCNSPAWSNILDVLASDESKWTLSLSALVLPIADRMFGMKDKHVLDPVIELVQILIRKHGRDIEKNHHPSLFKTRYREDCRTCFTWLGKLYTRAGYLLDKHNPQGMKDSDNLLHYSLLSSFFEALRPFAPKTIR